MKDSEVLIHAEHVSKKFCRSLKRSLWYGAQEVANSLMPWSANRGILQNCAGDKFVEPKLRKDEFWAVRKVSFEVRRGECLGLIGHNGAGKSTLLKMLNSLIRPDSGRITMRGRVGALIDLSTGFNPILSGRENIFNQAALLGFSKKETEAKFDSIVDFSEQEEFLDMPVQNYSSGMRVKLGFAVAAQMEPDILIIDEVLAVGDVGFRFKCINKMADLMNRTAVIFVSHTMPQILRVCNSVMHLEKGFVTYHGEDVSNGVDCYYATFSRQDQTIVGTGEVSVEDIEIRSGELSANNDTVLQLAHGDGLEIEMTVNMNPSIKDAVVQVLFWNMEMLPVLDVIGPKLKGFHFENNYSGKTRIRLNVQNLLLNSGVHFVSVVVSSPDFLVHYLRQDNAAEIRMITRTPSGAQSVTSGQWRIVEKN